MLAVGSAPRSELICHQRPKRKLEEGEKQRQLYELYRQRPKVVGPLGRAASIILEKTAILSTLVCLR